MTTKTDVRFVKIAKTVYLRKEDIVAYLLTMAETEPMDTKDRLEEAARLLGAVGQ
jgi:hypothetical protein